VLQKKMQFGQKIQNIASDYTYTPFVSSSDFGIIDAFKSNASCDTMRSKLFVPASRPDFFQKALASAADALSFDLEDAVTESRKAEARENLRSFLMSPEARNSKKTIIVRVNALDSPHFESDIQAVLLPRIDLLNLPKPGTAAEVQRAARLMEEAESKNGLSEPVRMLLNIETPIAIRNAFALASAHPRVAGLQLGFADLFGPLSIARQNTAAIETAMFMVRIAAGEAGVFVCDSAFADIRDSAGFMAEARRARDFGFVGKSCIHPSQISLANEAFTPTVAEIGHALEVVASIENASANGLGAFLVDGKMIDEPFIRRAQAIIAQAQSLGLTPVEHE
jgi:citrate lyase subunit beta/citryl-CoA lyase